MLWCSYIFPWNQWCKIYMINHVAALLVVANWGPYRHVAALVCDNCSTEQSFAMSKLQNCSSIFFFYSRHPHFHWLTEIAQVYIIIREVQNVPLIFCAISCLRICDSYEPNKSFKPNANLRDVNLTNKQNKQLLQNFCAGTACHDCNKKTGDRVIFSDASLLTLPGCVLFPFSTRESRVVFFTDQRRKSTRRLDWEETCWCNTP